MYVPNSEDMYIMLHSPKISRDQVLNSTGSWLFWKSIFEICTCLDILMIRDDNMLRHLGKRGEINGDPHHKKYELMPSGGRYRLPNRGLNRYKFSLVLLSIKLLNSKTEV